MSPQGVSKRHCVTASSRDAGETNCTTSCRSCSDRDMGHVRARSRQQANADAHLRNNTGQKSKRQRHKVGVRIQSG